MALIIIVIAVFIGGSFAAVLTIHNLSKSNEIGNSKSNLEELDGYVTILDREDRTFLDRPLM